MSSDVDRKFNDFFNMTMEMFEHQHHQLENYETSLSGLRQCCGGTTSDLSDFKARTLPALERLDAYLARNSQDQTSERCRQQIRFDADRILAAVKDQEKLILEGVDRCPKPETNETVKQNESWQPTPDTTLTSTTTTTTTTTTESTTSAAPTTTTTTATVIHEEASKLIMKTCEDLMLAGFMESKVYTFDLPDSSGFTDNGRDFRRRFCDQETSGGGWTVAPSMSGMLLPLLCLVQRLIVASATAC